MFDLRRHLGKVSCRKRNHACLISGQARTRRKGKAGASAHLDLKLECITIPGKIPPPSFLSLSPPHNRTSRYLVKSESKASKKKLPIFVQSRFLLKQKKVIRMRNSIFASRAVSRTNIFGAIFFFPMCVRRLIAATDSVSSC